MAHPSPPPAPGAGKPQSLDEAYATCTPLLMGALGRMARMGYRVNPAEGLDLVHDFFVEALPGVLDRFDARQARFTTYVYAAFVRFARPRIVRTLRWQKVTAGLDSLPAAAAAAREEAREEESEPFPGALTHCMSAAYGQLPQDLRRILQARIVEGRSEREVAKALKLSRYVVRQRSAEALGRLAVAIGREDRIPEPVRPMALRLWRDGRSLMDVARELGLSRQQAIAARNRLLGSTASALIGEARPGKETPDMAATFCTTWQQLMKNPEDLTALDALKLHLVELIDHVDECEACREAAETSPDAARVYERIAQLSPPVSPDDPELQAAEQARTDDERQIVEAMVTSLLPALRDDLQDLAQLGEDVGPLEAFRAADTVNSIAWSHAWDKPLADVRLDAEGLHVDAERVATADEIAGDIARHADVTPVAAANLLGWTLEAGGEVPALFQWFRSTPHLAGLTLQADRAEREVNLLERWSPGNLAKDTEPDYVFAVREAHAVAVAQVEKFEVVLEATDKPDVIEIAKRGIQLAREQMLIAEQLRDRTRD